MQSNITKLLLLIITILCLVWVFLQFSNTDEEVVIHNLELPLDFQEFYERFHSDSSYQMEHIDFPLEGILKNDSFIGYTYWISDDWKMHKPLLDLSAFNINYGHSNNIVVENISDRSDQYTMERRFIKENDDWELVYYEEMGPIMK